MKNTHKIIGMIAALTGYGLSYYWFDWKLTTVLVLGGISTIYYRAALR